MDADRLMDAPDKRSIVKHQAWLRADREYCERQIPALWWRPSRWWR
jgi:hypothetical protein